MISRGVPSAMLRWHYRSRHESLIATSNAAFYENRLVVLPSPRPRSAALGLSLAMVERGEHGDRRIEPGGQVADRDAGFQRPGTRFAIGPAGAAHHAAHALDQEIVAAPVPLRPILTEPGDRTVDQVRLDRQAFFHHAPGVVDVAVEGAVGEHQHLDVHFL